LDLSALGRGNARLLAEHLRHKTIDHIYSSDMRRARQTAAPVALIHDLEARTEPLLNEIDFGSWEGMTHQEITEAYPEIVARWSKNPFSVDLPEGEPLESFTARVLRGWKQVTRACLPADGAASTLLVVTHAGCIKIILGSILGWDRAKWWTIHQDKGALNYVTATAEGCRVTGINDTGYRTGWGEPVPPAQ
jgi:phosphoserine phosphatase